jgi:hypothetical protein
VTPDTLFHLTSPHPLIDTSPKLFCYCTARLPTVALFPSSAGTL